MASHEDEEEKTTLTKQEKEKITKYFSGRYAKELRTVMGGEKTGETSYVPLLKQALTNIVINTKKISNHQYLYGVNPNVFSSEAFIEEFSSPTNNEQTRNAFIIFDKSIPLERGIFYSYPVYGIPKALFNHQVWNYYETVFFLQSTPYETPYNTGLKTKPRETRDGKKTSNKKKKTTLNPTKIFIIPQPLIIMHSEKSTHNKEGTYINNPPEHRTSIPYTEENKADDNYAIEREYETHVLRIYSTYDHNTGVTTLTDTYWYLAYNTPLAGLERNLNEDFKIHATKIIDTQVKNPETKRRTKELILKAPTTKYRATMIEKMLTAMITSNALTLNTYSHAKKQSTKHKNPFTMHSHYQPQDLYVPPLLKPETLELYQKILEKTSITHKNTRENKENKETRNVVVTNTNTIATTTQETRRKIDEYLQKRKDKPKNKKQLVTDLTEAFIHREYLLKTLNLEGALKTIAGRNPHKKTIMMDGNDTAQVTINGLNDALSLLDKNGMAEFLDIQKEPYNVEKEIITKKLGQYSAMLLDGMEILGNTAVKTAIINTTIDTCKQILGNEEKYTQPHTNPHPLEKEVKEILTKIFTIQALVNTEKKAKHKQIERIRLKRMNRSGKYLKEIEEALEKIGLRSMEHAETALAEELYSYLTTYRDEPYIYPEDDHYNDTQLEDVMNTFFFTKLRHAYIHEEIIDKFFTENLLETAKIIMEETRKTRQLLKEKTVRTNGKIYTKKEEIDVECVAEILDKGAIKKIREKPIEATRLEELPLIADKELARLKRVFKKCVSETLTPVPQPVIETTKKVIEEKHRKYQELTRLLRKQEKINNKNIAKIIEETENTKKKLLQELLNYHVDNNNDAEKVVREAEQWGEKQATELLTPEKPLIGDKKRIVNACKTILEDLEEEQKNKDKLIYGDYLLTTHVDRKQLMKETIEKINQNAEQKYYQQKQGTSTKNKKTSNKKKTSKKYQRNPVDAFAYTTYIDDHTHVLYLIEQLVDDVANNLERIDGSKQFTEKRRIPFIKIIEYTTKTNLKKHCDKKQTNKEQRNKNNAKPNKHEKQGNNLEEKTMKAKQSITSYLEGMKNNVVKKALIREYYGLLFVPPYTQKTPSIDMLWDMFFEHIVNPQLMFLRTKQEINTRNEQKDNEVHWFMHDIDVIVKEAMMTYGYVHNLLPLTPDLDTPHKLVEKLVEKIREDHNPIHWLDRYGEIDAFIDTIAKTIASNVMGKAGKIVKENTATIEKTVTMTDRNTRGKAITPPLYDAKILNTEALTHISQKKLVQEILKNKKPLDEKQEPTHADTILKNMLLDTCDVLLATPINPTKKKENNKHEKANTKQERLSLLTFANYEDKRKKKYREILGIASKNPTQCTEELLDKLSKNNAETIMTMHNYLTAKVMEYGEKTPMEKHVKNKVKEKLLKEITR